MSQTRFVEKKIKKAYPGLLEMVMCGKSAPGHGTFQSVTLLLKSNESSFEPTILYKNPKTSKNDPEQREKEQT